METIEFSLKSLEVVQCRGKHNKNTSYHDRILALMNNNKRLIKKAIAS